MSKSSVRLMLLLPLIVACIPSRATTTQSPAPPTLAETFDSQAVSPAAATATHLAAFPVQGSILVEHGMCCVGGPSGEPLNITVSFEAASPFAPVIQMRTAEHCLSYEDMAEVIWEPYTADKVFQFTPPVFNWFTFTASVQFRDANGNLSPVYCDDIGVEGMPVTRPPNNP